MIICGTKDLYHLLLIMELDNGTRVIAMQDDEGNDGGVLTCLTESKEEVLPVLGVDDE